MKAPSGQEGLAMPTRRDFLHYALAAGEITAKLQVTVED